MNNPFRADLYLGNDGRTAAGSHAVVLQSPERYRALPAQHAMVLNSLRHPQDGVREVVADG
jgi:hypothetical protein